MLRHRPESVDLLILGAGWTSTFLIPALDHAQITHTETTTSGRDSTIPFKFDPESSDVEPYQHLPSATTVLVSFPLTGTGQSKNIVSLYRSAHGDENHWIQLGSTGIFNQLENGWSTENSPYDNKNARAIAEDELLSIGGSVLNLCGLWGGVRKPETWIDRIVKSKEDVKNRNSVHFIHGEDVARAIIGVHRRFNEGKRWLVTDLRVYDWWDLILSFSALVEGNVDGEERDSLEVREKKITLGKWVVELMKEEDVRALPRGMDSLSRKLDSTTFWEWIGVWPAHRRLA
ncbi:hypothetical protein B0J11DRAFT_230641 [Dendryphion nanum]|uniref:Uncharacterized protein n=1 Tax=Dendryphion nanum TaxID=256645 RepID=A0A9P9IVH2_9PLEO|nr:hypothetical protein B0J11DRAFT_230641 [Dendryphion nanum]